MMNAGCAFRFVCLGVSLLATAQAQIFDPLREASLLDDMVCRGDYDSALKLVTRDLRQTNQDWSPLVPYLGALYIETGHLQDADQALKLAGLSWVFSGMGSGAVVRERAALLLVRGEYEEAARTALKAYDLSIQERTYKVRRAYAGSIAAEALLRSGDFSRARDLANVIVEAVPERAKTGRFFAPRTLYAACLVESYGPSPERAEAICLRGLSLAQRSHSENRDLSLAYLTLAEVRLRSGNLQGSEDAAIRCLHVTKKLFGIQHEDAIKALEILSQVKVKEGKPTEARRLAEDAVKVGTAFFGAGSPRVLELRRNPALQVSIGACAHRRFHSDLLRPELPDA